MGTLKIREGDKWVKLPNIGLQQFPDAPVDGKPYNRKDAQWVEDKKEILSGNITTHTHDRSSYFGDMPTDVWDGVTVSSALAGSGTVGDPYLIQNCADYIHFYRNSASYGHSVDWSTGPTPEQIANLKQIRFTSNLDLNNVEIDFDETVPNIDTSEPPSNGLYFSVIDGQGSILSNINFKNTWAAIPLSLYCVIKNIHVQSGIFTVPLSIIHDKGFNYNESNKVGLQSFGLMYPEATEVNNTSFTAEVKFTGDIKSTILFVGGTTTIADLRRILTGYIEQPYSYANVTFSGDEGMINAVNIAYSPCAVAYEPGSPITCVHYDYTKALIDPELAPTAGVVVGMILDFVTANPYTLYVNTDNATPLYNSTLTPFHTAKTTAEMKSPEFLALLNGATDTFIADTNNVNKGYPIFKPKQIELVEYDGYIKKSAFDSLKNNINALGLVEIPYDVAMLSEASTDAEIISAVGGDSGFDNLISGIMELNGAIIRNSREGASVVHQCVYVGANPTPANKGIVFTYLSYETESFITVFVKKNNSSYAAMRGTIPIVASMASSTKNGLMSSYDYVKLSRLRKYSSSTTVANLNVENEIIHVTLSSNASLSASAIGSQYDGRTITAYVYTASARTITIPTSGNYVSMCGSSFTTTAGKWVEFNLTCVGGKWHIAKIEQE